MTESELHPEGTPPAVKAAIPPTLDAANITRAITPTVRLLIESASKVRDCIRTEPRFSTPLNQTERLKPHTIDRATILEALHDSVEGLISTIAFARTINTLARKDNRDVDIGAELITSAILQANRRKDNNQILEGEKRLIAAYVRRYGRQLDHPQWLYSVYQTFDLVGRCEKLPGPETYLELSASSEGTSRELRERLAAVREEYQDALRSEGPDGEEGTRLLKERDTITKQLDLMLSQVSDVDPKEIEEVCSAITIEVCPRPDVVSSLLDLYVSMGSTIARIARADKPLNNGPALLCADLIGTQNKDNHVMQYHGVSKYSLDSAPLSNAEVRGEVLSTLLSECARVRECLFSVHEMWRSQNVGRDSSRRDTFHRLENELCSIFVEDSALARSTYAVLGQESDHRVVEAFRPFLSMKVLDQAPAAHRGIDYYLSKKENLELLPLIFQCLIGPDEQAAKEIGTALDGGALRPASDLARKLRPHLLASDVAEVARVVDYELQLVTKGPSSFEQKAALLVALMQVSELPAVRRGLKGRLKNLDMLPQLVTSLNERLIQNKSSHAEYIEKLRGQVSRRFSFDLSDYWGKKQMVKMVREMVDRNLALLKRPDAWAGIAPSLVFPNGFLLYGDPGTGKTYFVTCLANEYGLPLIPITREEMNNAISASASGAKRSEHEVEESFAKFMMGKISRAEEERKKSGAVASIILIDEMEVEFLKRDPTVSSRDELTRTNVMLRVIESLITKHPEVLFIGATNYIEMVDKAALRRGRFGIHIELTLPEEDDVKAILEGTFRDLQLQIPEGVHESAEYKQLASKCVGMIPKAIRESINNEVGYARIIRDNLNLELDNALIEALISSIERTRALNALEKLNQTFHQRETQ